MRRGRGGRGAAEFQGGFWEEEGSLFRKGASGALQIRWGGGGWLGKCAVQGQGEGCEEAA